MADRWIRSVQCCLPALLLLGLASGCISRPASTVDGANSTAPVADTSQEPQAAGLPAPLYSAIPAPPRDARIDPAVIRARRVKAVGNLGLLGSQIFSLEQSTASVDEADHTCVLAPGAGQLSWAMYAFGNLLPEDMPLLASLTPAGAFPPRPCYVGIADYGGGVWRWTALSVPQEEYSLPIGAGANSLSPGGNLYIVIATFDGVELAIGSLGLQLDCPAPPPDGFDVEAGDGLVTPVHLSWIDPAVSFDPDGAGPGQFSYDGVQIRRAESPDGPWTDLPTVLPGTTEADDPGSIGGNPPPDGGYYYDIITLVGGVTAFPGISLFGGTAPAFNQLKAVVYATPVTATAGTNVTLSGTDSVHSGTLTKVQWDYEGNGTWDKDTAPALTTTHVYPVNGRFYPRLKLTMDLGGGAVMTDASFTYLAIGDARGDWSQTGRNAQHLNRSYLRGPKIDNPLPTFIAGTNLLKPAIGADGTIYIAGADNKLWLINANCTLKRTVDLGKFGISTPALTSNGYVWLNITTDGFGTHPACVWPDFSVHTYAPANVTGEPVIANDGLSVIIAASSVIYYALPSPPSGVTSWYTWFYALPSGSMATTPAVAPDGSVIVTANRAGDCAVYKFSADGRLLKKNEGISRDFRLPRGVLGRHDLRSEERRAVVFI